MKAPSLAQWRAAARGSIPVADAASALNGALEAGGDRLDSALVERAHSVLAKVDRRTALTGGHTVVALAGATGSGKSSLFNALVGGPVSRIGVRRPTSSTATAAIWGDEPSGELLDWLHVGARHHVGGREQGLAEDAGAGLDGLVLLDLPDFDSRVAAHRAEADRVLDLCDVFVWVTDPQKYADARLHDDYVARLADHQATTLVVLNQADRLSPDAVEACLRDLADLLRRDGVDRAEVLATSARDGAGVVDLARRLAAVAEERAAAERRLVGDISAVARDLRAGVADSEPDIAATADGPLVEALLRAAGIPTVLDAVERDYRRESLARTGWPFTRWTRALRPDPLRRLGLGRRPAADAEAEAAVRLDRQDVLAVLGRSSLPAPSPSARAAVNLASRELGDRAGAALPRRWADACATAAAPGGDELGDALDQAILRTPLRGRSPLWWSVLGRLQWLLALTAVVGFLWLVVLGVIGWLQLPEVPTPRLGALPWPFLLLVGGVLLGLALAALARLAGRRGARRRRAVVERRLRETVTAVAQERLVAPVRRVLEDHARTRTLLESALGGR